MSFVRFEEFEPLGTESSAQRNIPRTNGKLALENDGEPAADPEIIIFGLCSYQCLSDRRGQYVRPASAALHDGPGNEEYEDGLQAETGR